MKKSFFPLAQSVFVSSIGTQNHQSILEKARLKIETRMSATEEEMNFVQMEAAELQQPTFEEAAIKSVYDQEVMALEMRGKRLRRAALAAGIFQSLSVISSAYTIFAIQWLLIEWMMPDKTAFLIQENWTLWNFGILFQILSTVSDVLVAVLLGMIFIGAGVNPASSILVVILKIVQQSIVGVAVACMVLVGIFVDEDNALAYTMKNYFYSDNLPPIGIQIAYLFLLLNRYGIILSQIFGGLQYCLMGYIISTWGVLPRLLGYALFIAGPCYVISAFLNIMVSAYDDDYSIIFNIPGLIVQCWLAAWLLINTPHPSKNSKF